MNGLTRNVVPLVLAVALVTGGCSSVSSSPPKVVLNESVCATVHFLNLKLGQTNRVTLDNRAHSPMQTAISVTLDQFPVSVKGAVPAGSTIGDKQSTIRLRANAGEQQSVDLVPNFTGTYKATCGVSAGDASGSTVRSTDISFQIK